MGLICVSVQLRYTNVTLLYKHFQYSDGHCSETKKRSRRCFTVLWFNIFAFLMHFYISVIRGVTVGRNGIFFKTKTTRKFLFLTINGEHSDFFGKISGNRWNIVALAVSQS